MVEEEQRKVMVVGLIEKATNSTRPEVDPRFMKAIKSVVRESDSELRLAAQTLMSLMKKEHAQVRYLSLLIIDELFMRSKLFRTIVVENLDQLLSLSVGFRRNLPLPAPASVASVLRSKAIECLEKWNESFGIHYRQIRLGYEYLKNTLRFQFPNIQANAARIQNEQRKREMRTKEILQKKFEYLKANLKSIKDEIRSTVDELCECLDIIKTQDENDDMALAPINNEDIEEFRNSELRQIRIDSLKEAETVRENSDNKVLFDALRELYKILVTKHWAALQDWISVLIRLETTDIRSRDTILKEFIDVRNDIQSAKKRCEESGCSFPKISNAEEEDIWEEGTLVSLGTEKSGMTASHAQEHPTTSISRCERDEAPESSHRNTVDNDKLDTRSHNDGVSNSFRSKLLAEAPVVKWGSFLDNWGSKRDILANQRGLDVEGHWGRVDQDAVIPAEKIAELNVQAIVYEEDAAEIPPCRAPLRRGGLCQRRDLRICPFHGIIIPRDDEGKPICQSSATEGKAADTSSIEDLAVDCSSDLAVQLAKQAVKNVRERDREEAKKREHDKQALKRAKLAKVREHNDTVLRDAALASTSMSSYSGEDMEPINGRESSARSKKETLASMLKKKETTKDRLAQRLLNSRASDATVSRLTAAEDANYREAFPNQW